jgi:hypothetical protein
MTKEIFVKYLYLCKCGKCYMTRDDFTRHLKYTKRWRKYHYALDYNEIPFKIRCMVVS